MRAKELGTISAGLFGANLLWPYAGGGTFDAATGRFYPRFVAMVRGLGVTALRYPGGTTADSFDWERAIGAIAHRRMNEPFGMQADRFITGRTVLDGPVASIVGPDEFGRLAETTGAVGDVVVNFATGSVAEAADFVAYLTAPRSAHPSSDPSQPSYWAALRAKDGHPAPFDVPYFEVGNEQANPAEYGWRSGTLVRLGPHPVPCPKGAVATCLYAFGGTTRFVRQPVGTFADELPQASVSAGTPDQSFYAYYPPVVPRSERVEVNGVPWRAVTSVSAAGPTAHVYAFAPATGRIRFGNGAHGAIPPSGATVTMSYESGPHGGFVEFYRAMKRMNPDISVCESEGADRSFLRLMGTTSPYDCVVSHEYAAPRDVGAPLSIYEQALMGYPRKEGAAVVSLERSVRRFSGRDVPVVITEYGQVVKPMPVGDPRFGLSLDEGLLTAAQLREWIVHRLQLADKYVLASSPFLSVGAAGRHGTQRAARASRSDVTHAIVGRNIGTATIAGPGPRFVVEPSGLALGLLSRLAGAQLLESTVGHSPSLHPSNAPALESVAALSGSKLELVVINASPDAAISARVAFPGVHHARRVVATLLDGPSATAFNTFSHPNAVRETTRAHETGTGAFSWRFPAHSVTLLDLVEKM